MSPLADVGTYTTHFLYASVWGSLGTSDQTFPPGGPTQYGIPTDSNGLPDVGEPQVFHNLIWLKASSTQLNRMFAELRDSNGNTVDTSRILIEGTGGKAWVYSFDATAGATGFTQWGLYTPTNAATKGTVSIREIRSNGDIWMGNICATFLTGLGEAGEAIPDDATPAGGGTCAGQVNDALLIKGALMYPGSRMQTFVTWDQLATVKGFPYSTASNWDTEGNRAAWLTAGESIAPAFSSLSQFIGSFSFRTASVFLHHHWLTWPPGQPQARSAAHSMSCSNIETGSNSRD